MKILQICNKAPYPPRDGHTIAMFNIAEGLTIEGHNVKILSLNTKKHFVDFSILPKSFINKYQPTYFYINNSVNFISALKNLFSKDSYNVIRFYSKEFEEVIANVLSKDKFDIVQLETLFSAPYIDIIRKCSDVKIILRPHNVEHIIWERRAAKEKNPIIRYYLAFLAKRLKKYEIEVINKCDGIAAISEIDQASFINLGCKKPIMNIPIGLDLSNIDNYLSGHSQKNLLFIGSFDWEPNVDGIFWFLDNVWHKILDSNPKIELVMAGRNIHHFMNKLNYKNLIIAGEVPNAREFMVSNGIMIVPLRYGGGTRVKIIEAMAYGKPIITTNVGAEGLPVTNWLNIIITLGADDFASAIIKLFEEPQYFDFISKNAQAFAKENFDIKNITAKLLSFYELILKK